MNIGINLNGYYDEEGNWQRTKFCFVDCGENCTCQPPMGLHYSRAHDKRQVPEPALGDTNPNDMLEKQ